nr:MAG TPA: ATPase [Caudoviricetes sp.]
MIIYELEFENHVKLGNFKIQLDNPIVSIVGKNGSGKSFLLSELHPYPSSNRYSSAYSIIKGVSGYKRIIYKDNDIFYEIIHEYTPNNREGHSAKSYFNIIKNGVTEELNPTGNGNFFKDLVKKYLKFDHKTFNSSHISFKTNGLTESSAKNRRELLSDIVETREVENMTRNCIIEYRTVNNMLNKIKDGRSGDISGTVDELKHKLKELDSEESTNNFKMDAMKLSIEEDKKTLTQYDNLKEDNIEDINACLDALSMFSDNETVINRYNIKIENENAINRLFSDITSRKDKYYKEVSLYQTKLNKEEWINKCDITRLEASNKRSKLSLYINPKYMENLSIELIEPLKAIIDAINRVKNCSYNYASKNVIDIMKEQEEEKHVLEHFIAEYNKKYNNSEGGKEYEVEPCPSNCELYQRYVTDAKWVKENANSFKMSEESLAIINSDIELLKPLKLLYNQLHIIDKYTNKTMTDLHLNKDESFFINSLTDGEYIISVYTLKTNIEDLINNILSLENSIKDYEIKLDSIKHINLDVENPDILLEEIDKLEKDLKAIKTHNVEFNINPYLLNTKYAYMTKNALKQHYNALKEANMNYNKLTLRISSDEMSIKTLEKRNYAIITERVNIQRIIEDKIKVEQEYNSLDKDRVALSRIRTIMEKEIPLIMLNNVLSFLEKQTNILLDENNIPINIEIIVDDINILISASVNDIEIPDISQLSSGELCLVSLIMNACVLTLSGYKVFCLDEIDANLDIINRKKFNQIIDSLLATLEIDQIICISHSIESSSDTAHRIVIGDIDGISLNGARTEYKI